MIDNRVTFSYNANYQQSYTPAPRTNDGTGVPEQTASVNQQLDQ